MQQLKLKAEISTELQIVLFFNGIEMKITNGIKNCTLRDYNVQSDSNLHLMVLMYAINRGSKIRKLVFDLIWGFQYNKTDYLDGSCLLYNGTNLIEIIDYYNQESKDFAVVHSGDMMKATKGHHRIDIDLDKLNPTIDRLYFVLSSYNYRPMSYFKKPKVALFDPANPTKELAEFMISTVGNYRAVIMCALIRVELSWNVWRIGMHSNGTVHDYKPLIKTISKLPVH